MHIGWHYQAHGLTLLSDLLLPELGQPVSSAAASLTIVHDDRLPLAESPEGFYRKDGSGFHIAWGEVGAFRVTFEGNILYRRARGASDELIRVPLLGAVLAVALHFRGLLILHGNAMSVLDRGIVLVGAKGQGKSTLSAALVGRGHQVLAEDAAAVKVDEAGLGWALSGTRQLRLWSDSVANCFPEAPPAFRRIHELSDKCVVPLEHQHALPPRLVLQRIYVIEDGDEIAFERYDPAAAWKQVLVHSLVARFGSELLAGPSAARHFASCLALVRSVPCLRLRRPRNFARLGEVMARLEEDLLS